MRTKHTAPIKDSRAVSSAAPAPVVMKPVPMVMPNIMQQLAKAKQEACDIAASPPASEVSPEKRVSLEKNRDDLIAGAKKTYDDWFISFKADFQSKNLKFKTALEAAEKDFFETNFFDTDAMGRIEVQKKIFHQEAKSTKITQQASRDKAIATISADSERKIKEADAGEVAAHAAKLKAKAEEITELTTRVRDLDRQSLRDRQRLKLTGITSELKECFAELRAFQDRGSDEADTLMDTDTLGQLEKYTASTALQLALMAVRQYPCIRKNIMPAKADMAIDPVSSEDDEDDEDDDDDEYEDVVPVARGKRKALASGKKPALKYSSAKKLKLQRRSASDGVKAATLAASPYSNHSSSSSSAKRARKGGRKQMAFTSSSSSSAAAAASSSSDRPRA